MATVYLAEDLKHHRKVAVKVLRPDLAATIGPGRFSREIEVAARLQHPHILGVLDSGEADGFFYYVMPYVEGETLRDRLVRAGELPVPDAVRLLSEIAEALAVAHKAGVVHRDIKPENVLLSGRHALVADFGVAKAVTEATGRQQLTTAGVALGTPAYMAPEQAAADPQMDGRVDIYALGVLGYEMLTGVTPFHGLSPQQTLAAHLGQAPVSVSQRRAGLAPALDATIMKCLAKRPADRFQSADELVAALEPLAIPSGGMTPAHTQPVAAAAYPLAAQGASQRQLYAVAAAALLAIASITVIAVNRNRAPGPVAVAEQRQLTFSGDAFNPAISPDGKWLAYVSGDSALLVQEVAGGRAVAVLRGGYFREPVWSPEGGSLLIGAALDADVGRDAVWEIPRLGGEPRRVGSNGTSYDFSPDGRSIAWAVIDTVGITDRKTGREFRRLVVPDVSWIWSLRWSPDGRWLALGANTTEWGMATFLMDSAGPGRHLVARAVGPLSWNADGTALYVLSIPRIVREQIDRRSGSPHDTGTTVMSGLSDAGSLSLSRVGGILVVGRGPSNSRNVAIAVPPSGSAGRIEPLPLSSGTASVGPPAISPDGRWVAWRERADQSRSILLAPFTGGAARVIARSEGQRVSDPVWAPDSRRFAWFVGDSSPFDLYIGTTDGAAPARIAAIPAGLRTAVPKPFTWGTAGLIVPDVGLREFQLVDPASGHTTPLAQFDSLNNLYSPLLSPDGGTLIAARSRPFGYWNDVWQRRLDTGRWVPVPSAALGDHYLLRWDAGGVTAGVGSGSANGYYSRWEIWHARSPGAPFTPQLTGLRVCTGSPPSISDDNRHLACTQTTATSDIWLATDFDAGYR
jgi:serine/threonine-protein kinase